MSTYEPLFTWVHLSDVHMGHGDVTHGWNQQIILASLQEDIRQASGRDVPALDAMLVTGDLAFSGNVRKSDEYTRVGKWLQKTANSVAIGKERIFVIPGNHDIQRNVEERDQNVDRLLRRLRSGEESIDNALDNSTDSAGLPLLI
jgi:3',5'-cyclic AMP phosphodiesterase CpdA